MNAVMRMGIVSCLAAFVWSAEAMAIGGDATAWGARNPGACNPIRLTRPPTPAQATEMVRCKHEMINSGSGELWLMENLRITVGASMPFVAAYNTWVMDEADVRSRVYPLRGSFTRLICMSRRDAGIYGNPDLNCKESDVQAAQGVCWKTSFGDWRCLLTGASSGQRGPTRPPRS